MMGRVSIGDRVVERYSQIKGTVVAMTTWKYRTSEIAIMRDGVNNDGTPWDLFWCDIDRVAVIEARP